MWKKSMMIVLLVIGCVAGGVAIFMHSARFGALPESGHLKDIARSEHYARGEFQNLLPTPMLVEGQSSVALLAQSLWKRQPNLVPPAPVPTVKTPLKTLDRAEDIVVWLGHSSFYMQLGGRRILIDPVLSAYASPVSFSTRAFAGSSPYTADDLPDIDVLLLSHDHWDHLDYPTLAALRSRIGVVVCGLGVGAHLRRWGFSEEQIHEGDWGDVVTLEALSVHITPARHFSGRSLTRNKTLWAGFVLETPQRRVFYSGDSGYSPHFAELGRKFGAFDLVMLECGQYNERWPLIHMTPEETAMAAEDLNAAALLPAHGGKFAIAYHTWDDPYKRVATASRGKNYRLLNPRIGEPVTLADEPRHFDEWWTRLP